jgi:threonyl-tRNA synthetase
MINITLPDGSVKQFNSPTSSHEIALSISEGLARNVLAAKVNGQVVESNRAITEDSTVQLLTWNDDLGKQTFWHSSAHILAEALEALYPGVKLGIGPAIDKGFYYDIDLGEGKSLSSDDFEKIELKMLDLARTKSEFARKEVSKSDAVKYFTDKGDEYKLELIEGLNDGDITFYTQGGFTDLCKGPHIPNTGFIKAVKLMNIADTCLRCFIS